MKKLLLLPGYLMTALLAVATQPLYENNAALNAYCGLSNTPPTIDAFAFVNRSVFNVGTCLGEPFEVLNLWNFTNTGSGRMYGVPGFRFDHFSGNTRQMMDTWINQGSVTGETWVAVSAHQITSSGFLCTGPSGLIRLEGDTIDLKRDGIRSGETPGTAFGGGYTYLNGTNYEYYNAVGISDLYWGAGTNNYLNDRGQPMWLDTFNWQVPCSQSPQHQVLDARFGGRPYTNYVTVPQFQYSYPTCSVPYTAHVYISQNFGNQKTVQIVYVPTDLDPSLTTEVRFYPYFVNGGDVVVAFHMIDHDIVSSSFQTNSLFLVDSATTLTTNIILARPAQFSTATGRRPINYDLLRNPPYQFTAGVAGNAPFDPTLLYNANSLTNRVNMQYAAYAANLSSSAGLLGGTSGVAGEPTNYPGRVEISGNEVNLDQSRIRAESTIVIRAAENLVNNKLAKVDAPFVSYDLRSLQSPLYITNLAPASVRRLGGDLFCWTALWDGLELDGLGGTNTVRFHILMVDRSIVATRPVSVYEFTAHATNLVISDSLNISRSMLLDAPNLHITAGLTLPPNWGWGASNVPVTLNFTNDGMIFIPQSAKYGADRATPYWNFINNGTNTAGSQFIRTTNFVDRGSIIASSGILKVDARTASLMGAPTTIYTNVFTNSVFIYTNLLDGYYLTNVSTNVFTNSLGAMLLANADVEIYARDLYVSNSIIQAGDTALGALVMSVTNSLVNAGPDINKWVTTAGFRMLRQPTTGDLLYTHITSKAGPFLEAQHIWPAQDRGAIDASGYSNNLAVGQLTLDGANNTLFHFSAPAGTGQKAMYIDYLELLNNATNHTDPNTLFIETNLTIYIANANISPRKLELTHPGRIRWVPYFAGPLSTTNLTYPSGRSYSFNCALVADKSLDSDLDGMPNAYDETPMPEPILSMAILPGSPARAVFSWYSPAYAINWLEAKSETTGSWSPLTRVMGGAMNGPVSVTNAVQNENLRFYRIRVEPPPLN